jgi:hypothetical protein
MRKPRNRRMFVESLERRLLRAGDAAPAAFGDWHNESNARDVSGEGKATLVDAVQIVNVLTKYGMGTVAEMQAAWSRNEPDNERLYGGFHPDVSGDGRVTAIDLLQIVNGLSVARAAMSVDSGNVTVIPDPQGRPLRVVLTAADGRSKEVDVSQQEVLVAWLGVDAIISTAAGMPLVIAKPGVGILAADYSSGDGEATVSRFGSDGSEVIERYVCVPGFNQRMIGDLVMREVDLIAVPPDDVRLPIAGFEEVLGAIVTRQIGYSDGTTVWHEFQEATAEQQLSLTVMLPSGESTTVDLSKTEPPIDLAAMEADVLYLMQQGYRPAAPINPEELEARLEVLG